MNSPEKRDNDESPPRRSRSGMDAQERKLWDLDDDDDLQLSDKDDLAHSTDEPPSKSAETKEEPSPEPRETPRETISHTEESPEDEEPKSSLSHIEKISLGAFGLITLAIAIWLLSLFFKTLPTDDPTMTADFPVKGKNVVVDEITTYWRKPTESDRSVKTSARTIPAGIIKLGETKGRGAIRIFFEDDQGDLTGDAFTVAVSGGKFSPGDKETLEVICTDGLNDLGDLPGYLTGQIDLWYMIVMEGPSTDARGRDFKEILRLPIARQRR